MSEKMESEYMKLKIEKEHEKDYKTRCYVVKSLLSEMLINIEKHEGKVSESACAKVDDLKQSIIEILIWQENYKAGLVDVKAAFTEQVQELDSMYPYLGLWRVILFAEDYWF